VGRPAGRNEPDGGDGLGLSWAPVADIGRVPVKETERGYHRTAHLRAVAQFGRSTNSMPWFRPRDLLDQTFEVGIILKGLDGVLEVIGGLLLLVVSPATIDRVVTSLTQHELSEDPHDFVATHLLKTAHGLTGSAVLFGAIYLLAHGLVKVVLVAALLKNQLWAYPWTIVFLAIFIGYQVYRLSLKASVGLTALTIFDVVIAWLTYREYRKQLAVARP
jgi:uncharacterized membrane protein